MTPGLTEVSIGYGVDAKLQDIREGFFRKTLESMEEFIWSLGPHGYGYSLKTKIVIGHEDCWLLRETLRPTAEIHKKYVQRVLEKIAYQMGLQPAAFYEFLPKYYDSEFKKARRYTYTARCRFGSRSCVRPSHLIPCTITGHEIPVTVLPDYTLNSPSQAILEDIIQHMTDDDIEKLESIPKRKGL